MTHDFNDWYLHTSLVLYLNKQSYWLFLFHLGERLKECLCDHGAFFVAPIPNCDSVFVYLIPPKSICHTGTSENWHQCEDSK